MEDSAQPRAVYWWPAAMLFRSTGFSFCRLHYELVGNPPIYMTAIPEVHDAMGGFDYAMKVWVTASKGLDINHDQVQILRKGNVFDVKTFTFHCLRPRPRVCSRYSQVTTEAFRGSHPAGIGPHSSSQRIHGAQTKKRSLGQVFQHSLKGTMVGRLANCPRPCSSKRSPNK